MKPIKFLTVTLLLTPLLALSSVHAAELSVEVKGISEAKGDVLLAVYDKADSWLKKGVAVAKVAATVGSVTLSVPGLAEGEYAVTIFQDMNGNGKLDANFVGIPTEPFGFSNDATGKLGPAKFEQAKFMIEQGNKAISIKLRH